MSQNTPSDGGPKSPLVVNLERGWELLERGDLAGARGAAETAVDLDCDSADARVLFGALAAAEGDPEEALELMQQAMDLDSSYVRPVLLAAEICIHQLGDLDLGLDLLKEAEELAGDDQEELLEVLLLRVEGHLVAGEPAPAKELGEELARIPLEQPPRSLRIGRTLMELGQLDRAREHLLHAAEVPTLLADATYFLALASDFDRDPAAAEELFLKVLELDREADLPPWTVTRGAVDRALAQAMEVMDPQAREGLAQLPRVVSDLPPVELVCDGVDPRAMLFLSARQPPPPPELEPALPPDLTPTRIFIYQRNLERSCFSEEEMAEELSFTLEEEFANIMGDMDDMGHS